MAGSDFEEEIDVAVIIKAAPEISRTHGETVCVAGIDAYGRWHRLYPVPFKDLSRDQRFARWDVIRVRWRLPRTDLRVESKRIDPQSLKVVRRIPDSEKAGFVARAIAANLEAEEAAGRSLALIKPENPRFRIRRLSAAEFAKSQRRRDELHAQPDMLSDTQIPKEAPPVGFSYEFVHGGRQRTHQCIDWETERTFFKWREAHGEERTIALMLERWRAFDPERVVFAMGTHRVKFWRKWLLSGVLRVDPLSQGQLDF